MSKLVDHGYDAKLVGGCIRDLLLGIEPEDFDIITSARPDQITKTIDRSRIIGRRFRLVHVQHGRDVVEVSTYRRRSKQRGSLSLNRYGSIKTDSVTRDFTVNALYYDIEREEVLDYMNGLHDIRNGILRCIGKPMGRFAEDPCRMLRACRFASTLPLKLEPDIRKTIRKKGQLITEIKPGRLQNELEKMLLRGNSLENCRTLERLDLLNVLFPPLHDLDDLAIAALRNSDSRIAEGKPATLAFLIAAILWRHFRELTNPETKGSMTVEQRVAIANSIIREQNSVFRIPNQMRINIVDMWMLQARLEHPRPKTVRSLLERRFFRAAYDLLVLRAKVGDTDADHAQWWTSIQSMCPEDRESTIRQLQPKRTRRRRRRRPRSSRKSNPATQ